MRIAAMKLNYIESATTVPIVWVCFHLSYFLTGGADESPSSSCSRSLLGWQLR